MFRAISRVVRRPSPSALVPRDPTFICIGSQKAGTATMYDMLEGHRETWMPPIKELHFLTGPLRPSRFKSVIRKRDALESRDKKGRLRDRRDLEFIHRYLEAMDAGDLSIECYRSLFAFAETDVTGDITPAYATIEEDRVRSLAERLPTTKILYTLRDPISRVWSHARMRQQRRPRQAATILFDPAVFQAFLNEDNVLVRSLQSHIVERWRAVFGDRFKVMFFDDLAKTPDRFFADLCQFIGVDPDPAATSFEMGGNRKAGASQPMPDDLRAMTFDRLSGEYDRLAELVGGHAIEWRDKVRSAP